MKVVALKCPQCGGLMSEDSKYCDFCGALLVVQDYDYNIKYTYHEINDAEIAKEKRKELEAITHQKEKEARERRKEWEEYYNSVNEYYAKQSAIQHEKRREKEAITGLLSTLGIVASIPFIVIGLLIVAILIQMFTW